MGKAVVVAGDVEVGDSGVLLDVAVDVLLMGVVELIYYEMLVHGGEGTELEACSFAMDGSLEPGDLCIAADLQDGRGRDCTGAVRVAVCMLAALGSDRVMVLAAFVLVAVLVDVRSA